MINKQKELENENKYWIVDNKSDYFTIILGGIAMGIAISAIFAIIIDFLLSYW
jgi:hypothetical protein